MSAATDTNPMVVTGASSAGGLLLLFGLLFLLSFVQKEEELTRKIEALDIRSIEIVQLIGYLWITKRYTIKIIKIKRQDYY